MPEIFSPITSPEAYLEYAARYYVGASTFSESYFTSEVQQATVGHQHRIPLWGDFFARFARYAAFWAHYENNVYREVHRWSDLLKDTYDLYAYTRSIFSPAYRLVEFWASHVLGGPLDPDAGDGVSRPSAIPIVTENELIRPVIAQVWRDSNWQAKKEILARFGAAMGDVAIMVVDDEVKRKVQFRVIDPRTLRDVTRDSFGNVKAYIIEEQRPDPESPDLTGMPQYATYTEACEKIGDSIRYATFRNGLPYDWRAYSDDVSVIGQVGPEWTEDYGFVPLVFIQHRDMGLGWGWSELQPSLSKLHELDDLASKLDDWIRRTVDCPWLFTGCLPPGGAAAAGGMATDELQVGGDDDGDAHAREKIPTLYMNNPTGGAKPLIASLDIAATSIHIRSVLDQVQADHPELLADDVGPATSGTARLVAREKVEAMVVQRRAGYDDGLVRAHQMAISIGAVKEYEGFEAFTPDSFANSETAHSIGSREVFAIDKQAQLTESLTRATIVKTLSDSGISLESAMRQAGWGDDQVAAELAAKERQDARSLERIKKQQQVQLSDMPMDGGGDYLASGGQ